MRPQLLVDRSSPVNRFDEPLARGSAPAVRTCALLEKRAAPPEQRPEENDKQVKALVAATLLFMPFLAAYVVLTGAQ